MKKNVFLVLAGLLMVGLLMYGCKEKETVSPGEEKGKASAVTFDPAKVISKKTAGFVDVVEPETVSASQNIHTGGWAYDPEKMVAAEHVVIVSDGKQLPVSPTMGLKREDVAQALKNEKLVNLGWDTSFSANDLGKGKHKLEFYALLSDGVFMPLDCHGKTYCEIEVE